MFSDIVSDSYQDILDNIDPNVSYSEIYTPKEVVKMLAQMLYIIFLSDATMPNGKLSRTKKELKEIAYKTASEKYKKLMKIKK